ncbi:MAG: GNAT family N-acetyltransferase [Gammaproteobacteria bacterium]|nr:GNAT family N-acetyltransferase [Gammaproteobacteria bacterium]
MNYRRPTGEDFDNMVQLQNKYLKSALSIEEQANGFLSVAFTADQFRAMDQDLCIAVCVSDQYQLVGYLCSSTPQFNQQFPLLAAMINRFPHIQYHGKPLSAYRSFLTGPGCIDKSFRGQGIYLNLYQKLFEMLPPGYEVALTMIANDNPRSLTGSKNSGREVLGQFEFNEKLFWILARPVKSNLRISI